MAITSVLLLCDICCRRRPGAASGLAGLAVIPTTAAVPVADPATAPAPRHTYLDVVRANYSDFPSTQPLPELLDLTQAAHLHFHEPVYLSPLPWAELWITRADAAPVETVLREAADPNADIDAHVIDRKVAFVDWMPGDTEGWTPYVVCAREGGGFDVFWPTGHTVLKATFDYRWEAAFAWNRLVVVPTAGGVSIVDLTGATEESHYEFAKTPGAVRVIPLALTDLQGILAWTPWDALIAGSGQAARFVHGKWSPLTAENGWPGNLVHVVPLLDGSALQLLGSETGVHLAVATLDKVDVSGKEIFALVDLLNDPEPAKRVDAYQQLTRYGPGIWPILEKLAPDQPPEAAERIEQLLKDKTEPTLGGMKLVGSKSLTVADRLADGGVIFYAPDGVSIPHAGGEPEIQTPAWISVRPGEPIALLAESLTADLEPESSRIWAAGDEWIVWSALRGMQRFVGSGFVDLLRQDEAAFSEFVGIDHRGRWIMQKPRGSDIAGGLHQSDFLIIDPTLPDPLPRLPAWTFAAADSVGWDKDGWPVVKRGAAFALTETEWRLLDPKEKIFSGPDDAAAGPIPVTRAGSTIPTTTQSAWPTILVASDGTRYCDGQTTLRAVYPNGVQPAWPLPAAVSGKATAHLVRTGDGLLYLFNQGGRIMRIRPTPNGAEAFRIESTFTHDVPDTNSPTRVWLDPAGRIDFEWRNRLTIFFPAGYIPRTIEEKMESGGNAGH